MKKLLTIIVLFVSAFVTGQNKRVLDSLQILGDTTKNYKIKVQSLVLRSQNYFYINNDKVLLYLNQAIRLSKEKNYTEGLANSYNLVGILYAGLGKPDTAISVLNEAARIHKLAGRPLGQAASYGNIGTIYQELGNFDKALEYHFKCLEINESIKNEIGIAVVYSNIAGIYYNQHKLDEAYEWYKKALDLNIKVKNKRNEGNNRHNICMLFWKNGKRKEALQENQKAIHIFDSLGLVEYLGDSYLYLGEMMRDDSLEDKAFEYFNEAYKYYKEVGHVQKAIQLYGFFADHYYAKKQYDKSVEWNLKFIEAAKESKSVQYQRDASLSLAKVYAAMGKYEIAYVYMKRLVWLNDTILNEQNSKHMNELGVKYETEKKEIENRTLSQENQIKDLRLTRDRYFFIALGVLLALVLSLAVLLLRQNKWRAEQKNMLLEQKLLRSQMNPHFIFNSLTAIQNYILKHDQKEAVKYLSSFANITRSVLENSRMEMIPLKKEISLLENYLQLQKLRFGNRFDYSIHLDPEVDPENTDIPPMLSQPFIENALEHGMRDIETGGKIDVYFTVKDNCLLFEIIDNGRGMQSNDGGIKQHQSLAMAITKERVELMNKKNVKKTEFNISDAFPLAAEYKGVKVHFSIPL